LEEQVYKIRYINLESVPEATITMGDIDKFLKKITSMGFLVIECKPIKRRNKK